MTSIHDDLPPGHVSLDDIGLGGAYVLEPGKGQHSRANTGLRTLLTRAVDTHGDIAVMVSSGDENRPTMPHYHNRTTEAFYTLSGVVRIWLDDRQGTLVTRDVKKGEFALLPRGWVHAWAFAAPNSSQIGWMAPGGFENIVNFLDPDKPASYEQLKKSEDEIDVVWLPDHPLFGDADPTTVQTLKSD